MHHLGISTVFECAITLVLFGCAAESEVRSAFQPLDRDAAFPGAPGEPADHADLFRFDPLPGCAVSNATDLGVRTELRIFSGDSVSDADVHAFLGGLQRYYQQYGVTMFTRHDVIRLPLAQAMILDMAALRTRVQEETGIDLDHSTSGLSQARIEQATASLGRSVLYDVRELLRVYGEPRRSVINVVLLDEMVSADVPSELASLQGLAGFGLSPELLAKAGPDDPERALYDWLDAPAQFTPTAIVGVAPVKKVLREPDIVIAHEVGHAYGLVHVADPDDLMNTESAQCSLELDADQLATIRASAEAITTAATPEP